MSVVLERVGIGTADATILDDVSLTLESGTIHVLLGPTLSGKTSLMRVMAGLDRPDRGRVLVDGADVTAVSVRRRSVAMVYQQFINYPTLTVLENIASPLRVAGLKRAEIDARVGEAARLLRLEKLLGRLPGELSGGQQQRTAIARALVKQASLVLLDEPLANLDYKLREELREELPPLFARSGAILVYATTEPAEALMLGGRAITLWEGRVTQTGPTPEVYRRPATIEAARVFSDPPLNEADAARFPGLPPRAVRAGFRANHLQLGPAPPGCFGFEGKVIVTEITGSESFTHAEVDGTTWVALTRGVIALQPGQHLHLHIDPAHVIAFDAAGRFLPANASALEAAA